MLPAFDSYQEIKNFTAAGFSEEQAEKVVHLIMRNHQDNMANLATKDDLKQVEVGLRKDIEQVEVGLRKDIEQVEVGLRKDIESMKELMEAKFSSLKWVMPLLLLNFCAVAPALYGFIKSTIQVSGG